MVCDILITDCFFIPVKSTPAPDPRSKRIKKGFLLILGMIERVLCVWPYNLEQFALKINGMLFLPNSYLFDPFQVIVGLKDKSDKCPMTHTQDPIFVFPADTPVCIGLRLSSPAVIKVCGYQGDSFLHDANGTPKT